MTKITFTEEQVFNEYIRRATIEYEKAISKIILSYNKFSIDESLGKEVLSKLVYDESLDEILNFKDNWFNSAPKELLFTEYENKCQVQTYRMYLNIINHLSNLD